MTTEDALDTLLRSYLDSLGDKSPAINILNEYVMGQIKAFDEWKGAYIIGMVKEYGSQWLIECPPDSELYNVFLNQSI